MSSYLDGTSPKIDGTLTDVACSQLLELNPSELWLLPHLSSFSRFSRVFFCALTLTVAQLGLKIKTQLLHDYNYRKSQRL